MAQDNTPAHTRPPRGQTAVHRALKSARAARRELKKARARGILEGLRAGLGPHALCVDCGAHYGTVTSLLAETGARVHAFEPDPHSWEKLMETCGEMNNVTLVNAAVGVEDGEITLFRNDTFDRDEEVGSTGSSVVAGNINAKDGTEIKVRAVNLVAYLERLLEENGRIQFLKMDIEGAEVEILEHLVETDILPRINLTVVETHRWLFPQWRDRYTRIYEIAEERPELHLMLHWI